MAQTVKNLPNAGDSGSIPGSGRASGEGNGYPLQYSCLENPMDRGAWRAIVCGVTKNQTQLKRNWSDLACKHREDVVRQEVSLLLLLLLLSHFSRVWLCVTPETAAHQAPPSLGFSRQEHWSGLPFPSPTHESEKWKWSCVRLLATSWTAAYQGPLSMGFSRQQYWSGVPLPSPQKH